MANCPAQLNSGLPGYRHLEDNDPIVRPGLIVKGYGVRRVWSPAIEPSFEEGGATAAVGPIYWISGTLPFTKVTFCIQYSGPFRHSCL